MGNVPIAVHTVITMVNAHLILLTVTVFPCSPPPPPQPATVSRCGMVYLEPSSFGWRPLLASWFNALPEVLRVTHRDLVQALFDWLIEPSVRFVKKQLKVREGVWVS